MGPRIPTGTRLWLGGLAAGGVAVAHLVAFLLVAPDPVQRQGLLESTGHGAWPLIVSLAMGGLVVGLVGLVVRRPPREGGPPRGALMTRLLLMQGLGFLLLESLERLAMGRGTVSLGDLAFEPVIVIGLAAQVVTAFAAVMLLVLLDRIVGSLIGSLRANPRAPRTLGSSGVADLHFSLGLVALGQANPRGPPRRM